MKNPELVLAILGAGALIGAGLYFGMRASAPAAAPAVAPAAAPTARPVGPDARAQLREAIEQRRAELVRVCWAPEAQRPGAPTSEHVWNGTIGPEGVPLAFSVMEVRGRSRPGLTACLQDQLSTLRLPPRPDAAFVELPFALP
ncbi:MAG: hypothetical protein EOO75_18205 [Myxococcales bacterium]|nr:MAG: hypothetical protein EOO75_18205 [Myxococcales bacterium]